MAFLIGTDEAGYGPNLGPLTVCGTLWSTPQISADLYDELDPVVGNTSGNDKLVIADSKQVYSSSHSIEKLETSVLALIWASSGQLPKSWAELMTVLGCQHESQVWMAEDLLRLPVIAPVPDLQKYRDRLLDVFQQTGTKLLNCRLEAVFPDRFNHLVEVLGNKAEVLSSTTLGIANELSQRADGDLMIGCDKHGGRSKYLGMIHQYLTNEVVQIEMETPAVSRYRWTEQGRETQIDFSAKGESFLPTALASMVAKYVREVAMQIWNDFWQLKKPGLKPTKGYPVDAKRFKRQIESTQRELGISDLEIWRTR